MADVLKRAVGILALTAGLMCLVPNHAEATQLKWRKDFQRAVQEASRANKPMLVEFTAEWCGYCRKMKKTFSDEQVALHVESCFVPVTVDADEEPQLMESIGIKGLPTTVIISPDFKVIKRITGYKTPQQFNREIGTVCQADHNSQQPPIASRQAMPVSATAAETAFSPFCLVTLLEEQVLMDGSAQYSTVHQGRTLYFASAAHKTRFEREPAKYWPILDGNCIVHAVEQGEMAPGQPEWGAVYRGRLWFFSDADHRRRFADAPNTYLRP